LSCRPVSCRRDGTLLLGYTIGTSTRLLMLECINLDIQAGERTLVCGLDLALAPGDLVAMLGPNGVGKSLTLATLAGLRSPAGGSVRLRGQAMDRMRRRRIARQLGLMLQAQEEIFPQSVMSAVLLGRHPHLDLWSREDAADLELASAALRRLDLDALAGRDISTLSGGESRRLAMARLLVQDPAVMLLDEPTNHLDPLHQIITMQLLRELADQGKAILVSLHDPVLAARFARSVLLLSGDGNWQYGSTSTLLTPANLQSLYGTPWVAFQAAGESVLLPAMRPVPCTLTTSVPPARLHGDRR